MGIYPFCFVNYFHIFSPEFEFSNIQRRDSITEEEKAKQIEDKEEAEMVNFVISVRRSVTLFTINNFSM